MTARSTVITLLVLPATALAEYGINFPEPASSGAREIYDVHMLTLQIATVLMVIVCGFVAYTLYFHRKSRGYEPDQNFHRTWFGHWSWLLIPALVLVVDLTIAGSAQRALERLWVVPKEKMMDVKVVGHQWYWEYEYLDHDLKIESRFMPKEQAGDLYLREVDQRLVLPTHTRIRFLQTSADVNHAFWVPELGFKKDAIAGYVTETWAEIDREGVFRGQCAELCGTWHSRMPIVVEAVAPARFDAWIAAQRTQRAAAAAEAAADRTWGRDELIEKGRGLYNTKCAACHQITGLGLPPAFPPLKGSAIATGPLKTHFEIVLNGRPGTAMPAWAALNDLELAAIITYERNAWGNATGESVQPSDIRLARAGEAP